MEIKKYYCKIKSISGLSLSLAKVEFKLRNEGSYFGILWYLLNPIFMFLLLFLIFANRLGNDIPLYPLYLFLGLIIFNFFQTTTIESTNSIIQEYRPLIKSINFQRESLIAAVVLKNVFSHLFEIALFFLVALFFKVSLLGILYYLIILLFLCSFTLGASLILASLTVYFVDMKNIWIFASRIIWFATPIFYAIGNQTRLFYFNSFNPLYYFIAAARDLVIYAKMPPPLILLMVLFFTLISLFTGLLIFNKLKKRFAEFV